MVSFKIVSVIIASFVFLGLIVGTILLFRSRCPGGQTFSSVQNKCIPICNLGQKYYSEVDACLDCPPNEELSGDICLRKCTIDELRCGGTGECYNELYQGCTDDGRVYYNDQKCQNGTICPTDQTCNSENVCGACDNPCSYGGCCALDQICTINGCCNKNEARGDDPIVCCPADRWNGTSCCKVGFTAGGPDVCLCGGQKCTPYNDNTVCLRTCKEARCYQMSDCQSGWQNIEYDPPNEGGISICSMSGDINMQAYCLPAALGSQSDGTCILDGGSLSRTVQVKNISNKCTKDDCIAKLGQAGLSYTSFDNSICKGAFDCNLLPSCSTTSLPSGIPLYKVCPNTPGKFCFKGTCSGNGNCITYSRKDTNVCVLSDGLTGDYESLSECCGGSVLSIGSPVMITQMQNGVKVYATFTRNNNGTYASSWNKTKGSTTDNLDLLVQQVLFKADTGETCSCRSFGTTISCSGWFNLRNVRGEYLDGGAATGTPVNNVWKFTADQSNDWTKYGFSKEKNTIFSRQNNSNNTICYNYTDERTKYRANILDGYGGTGDNRYLYFNYSNDYDSTTQSFTFEACVDPRYLCNSTS